MIDQISPQLQTTKHNHPLHRIKLAASSKGKQRVKPAYRFMLKYLGYELNLWHAFCVSNAPPVHHQITLVQLSPSTHNPSPDFSSSCSSTAVFHMKLGQPVPPLVLEENLQRCRSCHPTDSVKAPHHNHRNRFTALFPGPPGWAGARRKLLDFMLQGNINRGRYTDHPAGRHSIRNVHDGVTQLKRDWQKTLSQAAERPLRMTWQRC